MEFTMYKQRCNWRIYLSMLSVFSLIRSQFNPPCKSAPNDITLNNTVYPLRDEEAGDAEENQPSSDWRDFGQQKASAGSTTVKGLT